MALSGCRSNAKTVVLLLNERRKDGDGIRTSESRLCRRIESALERQQSASPARISRCKPCLISARHGLAHARLGRRSHRFAMEPPDRNKTSRYAKLLNRHYTVRTSRLPNRELNVTLQSALWQRLRIPRTPTSCQIMIRGAVAVFASCKLFKATFSAARC